MRVTIAAAVDAPAEGHATRFGIQEPGEGEVATANGGKHVAVAGLGGREAWEGIAALGNEAQEGRAVELAEAAAECMGGGHREAPRAAGVGGTGERRVGRRRKISRRMSNGGGLVRLLLGFRWRLGLITGTCHCGGRHPAICHSEPYQSAISLQ